MARIVVFTSDKYLWLLQPFAYLFNVYWSSMQKVTVAGYSKPEFKLPDNFEFVSIDHPAYPMSRWSDAAIKYLKSINDSHVIILLEDYWLTRTVDHVGIRTLSEYMRDNPNVLRMDLTSDRLYNGQMKRIGAYGHYDLVETPQESAYQISLQAGIWKRSILLSVLQPGWSAHDVELSGSPSVHDRTDFRVVGTQQVPLRYANIMKSGRGFVQEEYDLIPEEHRAIISKMLPKGTI